MKKVFFLLLIIFSINIAYSFTPVINNHSHPERSVRKLNRKQKLLLKILFKKQVSKGSASTSAFPYGIISLLSGIAAGVIVVLAIWSVLPFLFAAAAIVFGIFGLKKNKKDIPSLIGVILGSTFYLLFFLAEILLDKSK